MSSTRPEREDYCFDPSPCECCPNTAACRAGLLTCAQFESFISFGGRRWTGEAREPSAKVFARVFRGVP
jgi:hypothetical protein